MKLLLSLLFVTASALFASAQSNKKILTNFVDDSVIATGHVGISIFNAQSNKFLLQHNADKHFVPSSNMKLLSMYAAMQFLGDSLPVFNYTENDTAFFIEPTGDPTFLHKDFNSNPTIAFLQQQSKPIFICNNNFKSEALGYGWSWNDYSDDYMVERSALPMYGNVLNVYAGLKTYPQAAKIFKVNFGKAENSNAEIFRRTHYANEFNISTTNKFNDTVEIPFITSLQNSASLLSQIVNKPVNICDCNKQLANKKTWYTQPTKAMLIPMMHRSDNFFAEQALQMVSQQLLGEMNTDKITDTLIKLFFNDSKKKPIWVDGSGLSRYNLFTPNHFIATLQKMKAAFGMEKLQTILTTGGQGTLTGYYPKHVGAIYAKTGSMSGNVSLSGFFTSKTGKPFIFSVHINQFTGTGRQGRRAIERFLQQIMEKN
jgi:serine-type D-Ala-D-Ala carboxypeptidase/endopeptidase (penicillin-binding protein 4)